MPTLSGTVTDESFANAARIVRAYRFDTGAFVGAALSDATTGAWSITTADTTLHFVVAHDATGDPHWGNTVLALRLDDLTDLKGHTVSHSGSSITTGQKFGTGCVYVPYSIGSALVVNHASDLNLSNNDFTIECFFKRGPYSGYVSSAGKGSLSASNAEFQLTIHGEGTSLIFDLYDNGTSSSLNVSRATTLSLDTWYHVAVVRKGNVVKLFKDGSQLGADAAYSGTMYSGTGNLRIGNTSTSGYAGATYFDDFRITKGVGRYTANFTAPTATFLAAPTAGTHNAITYDLLTPV